MPTTHTHVPPRFPLGGMGGQGGLMLHRSAHGHHTGLGVDEIKAQIPHPHHRGIAWYLDTLRRRVVARYTHVPPVAARPHDLAHSTVQMCGCLQTPHTHERTDPRPRGGGRAPSATARTWAAATGRDGRGVADLAALAARD